MSNLEAICSTNWWYTQWHEKASQTIQQQILLKIRNLSNYISFTPQIAYKLIEEGRSEDILQVQGLSVVGLNNSEDTTMQ